MQNHSPLVEIKCLAIVTNTPSNTESIKHVESFTWFTMLLALALNGSAGEGAAGIESASERILFTPSSTACNAEVLGNVQLDLVICKKKCHMPEQLLGLRPTFASQSLGVGALVVKTCMLLADLFFFPYFLRFYKTPRCLLQLLFIRPLSLANLCIPGVLSFLCICCVPLHFSMLPRRFSGHSISEQWLLNS